ncbi:hypothetical protein STH12_00989 [Shewanella khirikhana]|uniref:Uncharacterized protein n=1 Tax=Shewanella khirikhana TaxID=1965282 RepID=A0ABM7D146_9GAMM|nr:hypothetical protein STH12_00989 [Shewanella khirikhana]
MPSSRQDHTSRSPLTLSINNEVIQVLHPCNSDASAVEDYIPSIDFRSDIHKSIETVAGNLNGFFKLYNHWVKGDTKCDYSVVMEMTIKASLISSQFERISKQCKKDRGVTGNSPLTLKEQIDFLTLSESLNVTPSELISMIKNSVLERVSK